MAKRTKASSQSKEGHSVKAGPEAAPSFDQLWTKIEAERRQWGPTDYSDNHSWSASRLHFIEHGSIKWSIDKILKPQAGLAGPATALWIPVLCHSTLHAEVASQLITLRLRSGPWVQQNVADREVFALIKRLDAYAMHHGPELKLQAHSLSALAAEMACLAERWQQVNHPCYHSRLKAVTSEALSILAEDAWLSEAMSDLEGVEATNRMLAAGERLAPALKEMARKNIIAQHDLRVADLAALCGYKPARFHALFLRATGTTPQRYLTERRIQLACDLLQQPHESILDVAYSSGFGTPSRFYQAFKSITGHAPRQWLQFQHNQV